jgi:multiple sugar transport system ATP-binding protein
MNVVSFAQLPAVVQQQAPAAAVGGSMGLRPEAVLLRPNGQGAMAGRVELVEALGAETLVYVSTAEGATLVARQSERTALVAGSPVALDVATEQAHWFDTSGRVVRHTAAPTAATSATVA